MQNSPFDFPINKHDYDTEYAEGYDADGGHSLWEKIKKADSDAELIAALKDDGDTDDYSGYDDVSTQTQQTISTLHEQQSRARAKRQFNLANQIIQSGKLLITEERQSFAYQEAGYYRHILHLDQYLVNLCGYEATAKLDVRDVRETVERLSWSEEIRCSFDSFNSCGTLVNLENGLLDLETGELLDHSPQFRFTYVIHASYLQNEEDPVCPDFDRFCKTSLDGDPDKRQLLLEFIGYICTDTNAGKCAMFLKGQPDSGKSVIAAFISRLFDAEVVSNIPLHQLGDRFFRAELFGKKLNVAGEIAGRTLKDISIFKCITGNDRITGEFKGRDPFYFTPRCKLLFSGNTMPYTTETDSTTAFANRLRVLLFNHSVPPQEQDRQLLDKLWEERDAIVTLALQAARDLMERNFAFTLPEDSRQFLDSYAMSGNLIQTFLAECCELHPDAKVFNVALYAAFSDFCAKNGVDRISRAAFYEQLSGVPHVFAKRIRMSGENRQAHVGIRLKEDLFCGTLEQGEETSCSAMDSPVP